PTLFRSLASPFVNPHTHRVTSDATDSAVPPYAARQRPARACDHPGCAAEGEYRAPRSRERLTEYYWFCLDHVRAYNKAWDYCAGMGPDDVEHQVRRDTVWRRPAWPFGGRAPEKDPIPWRIG